MYRKGGLEEYVSDAAAKKPAPGGGSVSALVGALAAAMSEMSANFTVGNKKFASVEGTAQGMLEELADCRDTLLALIDLDVEAYGAVDEAYGMPKDTGEQKAARRKAMRTALLGAMAAPLDVMRQCSRVAAIAEELVEVGNPNLITDVGVSAILAEAACAAARLNVEVNLKFLRAPDVAEKAVAEMDGLSSRVQRCRERVARKVSSYLAG